MTKRLFLLLTVIPLSQASASAKTCPAQYQLLAGSKAPQHSVLLTQKKIPLDSAKAILAGDTRLAKELGIADTRELRTLTAQALPGIEQDLRQMDTFLAPVLHLPETFTVQLSAQESRPSANFQTNLLTLGYQYAAKAKTGKMFTKHPVFSRAVNLHEYAHLILETNFKKKFPNFVALRERARKMRFENYLQTSTAIAKDNDALMQSYERVSQLKQQLLSPMPESSRQELRHTLHAAQAEKRKLVEKLRPHLESIVLAADSDFFTPYHELFSDLVPALFLNDKNAIYNSLHFSGGLKNDRNQARFFGALPASHGGNFTSQSGHGFLGDVRKHIGENLMPEAKTVAEKQRLIKAVYQAIESEVEEGIRTGNFLKTKEETVKSMIQRIDSNWHASGK
jgi:hypothetical protein